MGLYGLLRRCQVKLHAATDEVVRIEHAEHQVCVCGCRLRATTAVAGRPWLSPCALWADSEVTELDRRQAATASAYGSHIDRWNAQLSAGERDRRAHDGLAVDHDTHIKAGPTDIDTEDVALCALLAHGDRAHHTCCGT